MSTPPCYAPKVLARNADHVGATRLKPCIWGGKHSKSAQRARERILHRGFWCVVRTSCISEDSIFPETIFATEKAGYWGKDAEKKVRSSPT